MNNQNSTNKHNNTVHRTKLHAALWAGWALLALNAWVVTGN